LTFIERVAIVLASLGLSIGLIALLSGFFANRDQAGLSSPAVIRGVAFRDLGDARLKPGQPRPRYDSRPPTSGAHFTVPVTADDVRLSEDQVLTALSSGDVVILYGEPHPPAGLATLARALGPPFTPAVARAGQAVILSPRPGTTGLIALAWAHMIQVRDSSDPALRDFVAYWLGRGAPRR
jgi:Protein of unknown function (DUF3105)